MVSNNNSTSLRFSMQTMEEKSQLEEEKHRQNRTQKYISRNQEGSDRNVNSYRESEEAEHKVEREETTCTFSPAPSSWLAGKGDQTYRDEVKAGDSRGHRGEAGRQMDGWVLRSAGRTRDSALLDKWQLVSASSPSARMCPERALGQKLPGQPCETAVTRQAQSSWKETPSKGSELKDAGPTPQQPGQPALLWIKAEAMVPSPCFYCPLAPASGTHLGSGCLL